jgi:hypothetical protein
MAVVRQIVDLHFDRDARVCRAREEEGRSEAECLPRSPSVLAQFGVQMSSTKPPVLLISVRTRIEVPPPDS